jgi:hypothetical protein
MKSIILLGAAALPLGVHAAEVPEAAPAPHSYMVIDVEYWGTVSNVQFGSRRVGDAITGSSRIDLRFAPSDFWDDSIFPNEGEYIWNFPCERNCGPEPDAPSRFVTTRGAPVELGGNSFDRVFLFDTTEGSAFPADEFRVRDWELGAGTGDDYSELRVDVGASSRLVNFIRGDDLLQEFDLRPAEVGGDTHAGGSWHEAVNGMTQSLFEFAIDRLRVTPKVCRI